MERDEQGIFSELPEALVEEVLEESAHIGEKLFSVFKRLQKNKNEIRKQLLTSNILKSDRDIGYPQPPTTCGVDGSYAIERLLAIDLVACAAVAIEGLTPPSETRYWEKPNHLVFIAPEKHDPDTGTIIRGIMMQMEFELAVKAPHDVVMLDGSLTTPLIYMNQAVNKALGREVDSMGKRLIEGFEQFLTSYRKVLESSRTDKIWVSLPKYTTRRELGEKFGWPPYYDDRALLTFILQPGEYTMPIPLAKPAQPWHLKSPGNNKSLIKLIDEIISLINRIYVVYYKPHRWTPALRIEMSSSVAANNTRLSILFQGLRYQCCTPGIMEPYPLFIADRIVKHLGNAMPAFRQTSTRRMIELHTGDVSEIFFSMYGYRTEGGKLS